MTDNAEQDRTTQELNAAWNRFRQSFREAVAAKAENITLPDDATPSEQATICYRFADVLDTFAKRLTHAAFELIFLLLENERATDAASIAQLAELVTQACVARSKNQSTLARGLESTPRRSP